ncbi:sulfatase-like hydrolase/transferase, partial [Reyranella sp.]|uniref:sulfatase-like hydrolase/transferase n=1 Tax=Reyranella sp. TaxID=1929291 RepID=UPI003D103DDC
ALPGWLVSAASGWYLPVAEQAANLFERSRIALGAYLLAQVIIVAAVFAVPFLTVAIARYVLSALLLGGIAYDLALYAVAGQFPNYETTATMIGNLHVGFRGTFSAYAAAALPSIAAVMASAVIFCWKPPASAGPLAVIVTTMAFFAVGAILVRSDGHTTAFPSPVTSYINVYKSIVESADQPLEQVRYDGPLRSPFDKIVLIVDESIRGDYISLNDPQVGTTPFLLSRAVELENFGLASSGANCSTQARLILRFGARLQDLQHSWKTIRTRSALWQFARHAGFETAHIDAQGTAHRYDSGMTATEASHVDLRVVVDSAPPYGRDEIVASTLLDLLRRPGRLFILADKYGVHVPYDKAYPPEFALFPTGGPAFSLADRPTSIAYYKNAIRWSVDHFFQAILTPGIPEKTLVLYTSDHGQSLSATGMSHCNTGKAAETSEAIVPLFALTSDTEWRQRLAEGAIMNFDKASHFELFPTVLRALGYDEPWVRGTFGSSLVDRLTNPDGRWFWAGGKLIPVDR